jgi:hypothetical protein
MNMDRFWIFQSSHRFSTIASAFINILMMGCLAIAYSQAALRLIPDWRPGYLVWVAMLISAEAMFANYSQREKTFRERLAFHLSEWLVIMLLLQVVIYARRNFEGLASDIARLEESLMYFFHPEFLLVIIPIFLIWLLSLIMAEDLARLEVDQSELQLENPEVVEKDRRQIRRGMAERVLVVGLLLVAFAFIARLELVQIFGETPVTRAPVYSVVAYFVLALVLISQVQLSALRGHWLWTKAPIRANLARDWFKYSILFFVLVGAIAIFLPTQYSLGFLDTLGYLLHWLGQAIMFLAFLVLWPIITLINFLLSLFRSEGDEQEPLNIEPPQQLVGEAGSPVGWWELVKAILFWTLIIGVTGYFVIYYIRQNHALWSRLQSISLFRWLSLQLKSFWRWMRRANQQLALIIAAGRQRLFSSGSIQTVGRSGRAFNLRRASARQKVIFFYLRMIERGKEEGLERKPAQTPIQYREVLGKTLPEVEGEVNGMTASFMEARYTRHEIGDEQAGQVQSLWKRILQALRGKKKS